MGLLPSQIPLSDRANCAIRIILDGAKTHPNPVRYRPQDPGDRVDEIYERLEKAGMQPGKPENMHVEVFHQRGVSHSQER
jgi:hypothetical protein